MKFCPHCGSKLALQGSRFCQECGKELPGTAPSGSPAVPSAAEMEEPVFAGRSHGSGALTQPLPGPLSAGPARLSPWFWVGFVVVLLLLVSWLLPALSGTPSPRYMAFTGLDIILIIGFMNAYLFRRVGRRRVLGFVIGALVGLAFLWSAKVALGGAYRVGLLPLGGSESQDFGFVPDAPVQGSADGGKRPDAAGWTQESTGSDKAGPWLDYSPAGTRFYRDAGGIIYRVYPPGVKPDAPPANPFDVRESTEKPPGR